MSICGREWRRSSAPQSPAPAGYIGRGQTSGAVRHPAVRQPHDWETEEVQAVQVRPRRQDAPAHGRVLLPTFLTSARGAQPNRGSVSFVGDPLPRMTGHDLVCSIVEGVHAVTAFSLFPQCYPLSASTGRPRTYSTRLGAALEWCMSGTHVLPDGLRVKLNGCGTLHGLRTSTRRYPSSPPLK
jgi:hypothetical protein